LPAFALEDALAVYADVSRRALGLGAGIEHAEILLADVSRRAVAVGGAELNAAAVLAALPRRTVGVDAALLSLTKAAQAPLAGRAVCVGVAGIGDALAVFAMRSRRTAYVLAGIVVDAAAVVAGVVRPGTIRCGAALRRVLAASFLADVQRWAVGVAAALGLEDAVAVFADVIGGAVGISIAVGDDDALSFLATVTRRAIGVGAALADENAATFLAGESLGAIAIDKTLRAQAQVAVWENALPAGYAARLGAAEAGITVGRYLAAAFEAAFTLGAIAVAGAGWALAADAGGEIAIIARRAFCIALTAWTLHAMTVLADKAFGAIFVAATLGGELTAAVPADVSFGATALVVAIRRAALVVLANELSRAIGVALAAGRHRYAPTVLAGLVLGTVGIVSASAGDAVAVYADGILGTVGIGGTVLPGFDAFIVHAYQAAATVGVDAAFAGQTAQMSVTDVQAKLARPAVAVAVAYLGHGSAAGSRENGRYGCAGKNLFHADLPATNHFLHSMFTGSLKASIRPSVSGL